MVRIDRSRKRSAVAAISLVLILAGCKPEVSSDPHAAVFRRMIIAFADAASAGDTATLSNLSLDQAAITDAKRLTEYHSEVLQDPEEKIGHPHYVTLRGDTAIAMLFVQENGRREFGAEFRRVGGEWRIARIGFSPK